jgi:hypothetical protein
MPPTKRKALLQALSRNGGELDPELLRRLLAALSTGSKNA